MGTSTPYGGPGGGTPLIPSWLSSDGGPPVPPQPTQGTPDGRPPPAPAAAPSPLPSPIGQRFSSARGNFTRFATSGGADRASFGRALSSYVSSVAGGSHSAMRRMGASRGASARLIGFLGDAQVRGATEALRALRLEHLAGRSIRDVFLGLVDYISPAGGTIDEAIAREAFVETIAEVAELGVSDLDALSADQMQTLYEIYIANTILARLCNDIGTKAITMPPDIGSVERLQRQIRDFIRAGVSDALTIARANAKPLTQSTTQKFVDLVYEEAFTVLKAMADSEGN